MVTSGPLLLYGPRGKNMSEDKSRFSELAMELMGAEVANKFLSAAWETAGPDVKRSLADALIVKVQEYMKINFEVREQIRLILY